MDGVEGEKKSGREPHQRVWEKRRKEPRQKMVWKKIRGIEGDGKMQHVFLVGAKSLGAYGGYETFINKPLW